MGFITIDKKIEETLCRALMQAKKDLSADVFTVVEKIILEAIKNNRLSIDDINAILDLIDLQFDLKKESIDDEVNIKRKSNDEPKKRCTNPFFDYVFFEHINIIKLLNLYKMRILNKENKRIINKR